MEPEAYHNLLQLEQDHWYYAGKRRIAAYWIRRMFHPGWPASHLDVGAGSGIFVREMAAHGRSVGVEFSAIALKHKVSPSLVQASILNLPFADATFDCTTSFDVLEHVDEDQMAFRELMRVTRPGGCVFLNVPAFPSLWSDWDVSLHHKRRYVKSVLAALLDTEETAATHLFYINWPLFIPIFLYRRLQRRFHRIFPSQMENLLPAPIINRLLEGLFVSSAKPGWRWMPWGVSIFAIVRKKS